MRGLRGAGEVLVVLFLCMIVLSSCQKGNGKKSESGEPEKAVDDTTPPVASTASSGRVGPSGTDLVTFSPEAGSAAAGSEVTFPPGSLAVETNVRVEDGTKLATAAVLSAMGVQEDNNVQTASESVAILADDTSIEAATPFTVALKLNTSSASLADSDLSNLIVIYQANVNGAPVFGVIPRSELNVENGKISFGTVHFGVYQAALVELPTSMPTKQVPSGPIATKRESIAAPLQVTQFTPVAFTPGTKVEVKGVNLRPSIEVLLAGIPAVGVIVSSATTMSFVVPADVKAGNIDVLFRQDGVSSTISGFVASGTQNVPSISDDPTKRYVTDVDRASWNMAAAWGDHRQAGYLKELGPARFGSLLLLSAGGIDTNNNQTALTLLAPTNMSQSRSYVLPLPPGAGGLFLTSDSNGTMSWASAVSNVSSGFAFDGSAGRSIAMDRTPDASVGQNLTIEAGGTKAGNTDQGGGTLVLSSGVATGSGSSRIDFLTATAQSSGTSDNAPSAKMTILGNGNVGIGTSNPQASLDVQGTTGIRATQICDETGSNCKDISSGWGGTGDMLNADNLSGLADAADARTNLGLGTMAQHSANAVAITGGSIQNVGIGTATISGSSIISGTLSSSGVGAGSYFTVAGNSPVKFSGATAGYTALQGYNGTASNVVLKLPVDGGTSGQVLTTSGSNPANLSWTTPPAGTVTSVATGAGLSGGAITASGTIDLLLNGSGGLVKNLGVGTNELGIASSGVTDAMLAGSISQGKITNLTADLATKGNVFNGNQPNGALTVGTNDATALTLETNGSDRVTVSSGGNVGINTTSPASTLDVKGTLRLSGSTSGFVDLAPAASAGSTSYTLPNVGPTNGYFLQSNGSGVLSWAAAVTGPSGSTGEVQFRNGSGQFASSTAFSWDDSVKRLVLGNNSDMTSFSIGQGSKSGGTAAYTTAIGNGAGSSLTSATKNTLVGAAAGASLNTGSSNVFVGNGAGQVTNVGQQNVYIGEGAGGSFAGGLSRNTMIGHISHAGDASTQDAVAIGWDSAAWDSGVAVGKGSVAHPTGVAIGIGALSNNSGVAVGHDSVSTGVGVAMGPGANAGNMGVAIGDGATAAASTVSIAAGSSEVLHISPGGNTGIGVLSPTEKLDVAGRTIADAFVQRAQSVTVNAASTTSISPSAGAGVINLTVNYSGAASNISTIVGCNTMFAFGQTITIVLVSWTGTTLVQFVDSLVNTATTDSLVLVSTANFSMSAATNRGSTLTLLCTNVGGVYRWVEIARSLNTN